MTEFVVIFITFKSKDEAEMITNDLLSGKMIACSTLVSPVQSHYSWMGQLTSDTEVLAILKTQRKHMAAIIQRVKSLHSYQVPEIIALPILDGSVEYTKWIEDATN